MDIPQSTLSDYAQLRKIIIERGFMKRRRLYFFGKISLNVALMTAAIIFLLFVSNLLLVVVAAAFFGFVWGQVGLLMHDAGHRQVFVKSWKDSLIGFICAFFLGGSFRWWVWKHNEHHAHPNHEDMDPDIDFPVLAFSKEQALQKKGIFKFIVRHQAIFFFPMMTLVWFSMRASSMRYLVQQKFSKSWPEFLLWAASITVYLIVVFSVLAPLHAIVFIVLHQSFFGLYMGMVFAPNHKGMPIIGKDEKMDFLRQQVLTARNVRCSRLVDFWYGGLNYQIEHHLFPHMPRLNLRKARKVIKEFCREKNIAYYETGVLRSYYEILKYMHSISLYCRVEGVA